MQVYEIHSLIAPPNKTKVMARLWMDGAKVRMDGRPDMLKSLDLRGINTPEGVIHPDKGQKFLDGLKFHFNGSRVFLRIREQA